MRGRRQEEAGGLEEAGEAAGVEGRRRQEA